MKRLIIVFFCLPIITFAQNKTLVVEGVAPNLYLTHTVAPKENFYSVGRIYNISPRDIAPFNNLDMEKGLILNQVLKIPLNETNFLQQGNAGEDEVLVPIYHAIKNKESLAKVSNEYNQVPVASILNWNNLKSSTVPKGTKLIVGYLKVKKDLSSLAAMAKNKPADDVATLDKVEKPVAEKSLEVTKAEPVKEKEVTAVPAKKAAEDVVATTTETTQTISRPVSRKNYNGGIFKPVYEAQTQSRKIKDETGTAGTFKSSSGWEDGKYYCLYNKATPGTIIKITNPSTGKNVYAKVLDLMPDMKQNEDLVIRLSNAAADELGAGETVFNCKLSYVK